MRKLTAVFMIVMLVLGSAPLFAQEEETKAHPRSPFNIASDWFGSLGKRADGTSIWAFEQVEGKSWLTVEEVIERRGRVGTGMRGRIE